MVFTKSAKTAGQMNSIFLKNLRFWSWHCSINALPSFFIAGIYLEYFHSLNTSLAMLSGVIFFILAYSTVFTIAPQLRDEQSRLTRALALALLFRIILTIFGIIGVMAPVLFFFHPDYYAGLVAFQIQKFCYDFFLNTDIEMEQLHSFFDVFLWTILEGALLTLFLIALSFLALLVVRKPKRQSCL